MPDPPTEAEVAAALAAVHCYLEDDPAVPAEDRAGWRGSARLAVQQLRPMRVRGRPAWPTIERLRGQASGGFTGVIGL